MAIGTIGRALATALSNYAKATTKTSNKSNNKSNTKPINNNTSNNKKSNNTSSSNKSYAYDPSGNRVNVNIVNGQSYLDNGQRVGTGYTVQTGGGIYKMGSDGKGQKVNSHNTANNSINNDSYVNTLVNSLSTGRNKDRNAYPGYVNNVPAKLDKGDTTSKSIFKDPVTDYTNLYNDALMNIYNNGNNFDNSVLREMFTSDVYNINNTDPNYKRYGTFDITPEMISGYDTAYNDLIDKMTTEYNSFDDKQKGAEKGLVYKDVLDRVNNSTGNNIANNNYGTQPVVQNTETGDPLVNVLENTPTVNTPVVYNSIPVVTKPTNINSSTFIPFDDANPEIGGLYETNDGYVIEIEGEKTSLSEEEYIELMEEILGF